MVEVVVVDTLVARLVDVADGVSFATLVVVVTKWTLSDMFPCARVISFSSLSFLSERSTEQIDECSI